MERAVWPGMRPSFLPSSGAFPVPPEYKAETPGADADLNAYEVVYVGGDANAGSKTIAINLPNDPEVQLQLGARRLQLKNAMRAKFDRILVPIVDVLMAEDQRSLVTFDAFFENTMFHEVAHGLGIKNTINGLGPVQAGHEGAGFRVGGREGRRPGALHDLRPFRRWESWRPGMIFRRT